MTAHLAECRLCQARLGELDDSKRGPLASAEASGASFWAHGPGANGGGPQPDKGHFFEMLSQLGKRCGLDLPSSCRTSLDDPPPAQPPNEEPSPQAIPPQLGQYQLLEVIGEGGMGIVYRAQHLVMKRERALKLLHPDRVANAPDLARFYREIEAVARLEHPNIVVGHDAQEAQGHHFLVMEFVRGLNLSRLLARLGRLPIADACELMRQAAVGLDYAHAHELVHRDVKPSNLLLSDRGVVKILDLGLASHRAEDRADERDVVLGTVDYIAPEQWQSAEGVDRRADVYSLGCTLYQLLVGKPPFGDLPESHRVKAEAHCRQSPPSARAERSDVPAALEALLERMLAKRPQDRPDSAAEVAKALARFTAGSDLVGLLERAGHEVDTEKIPRGKLSTLFSRRKPGQSVSRRVALAMLLLPVASLGLMGVRLIPWWSPLKLLPKDLAATQLISPQEGNRFTLSGANGFTLAAQADPAMLPLGTLQGVYRLSTTLFLSKGTERAGLFVDYGKAAGDRADRAAQAIVFVRGQNDLYTLQWQRLEFVGAGPPHEEPEPPLGSVQVTSGERIYLEVECGPEGIRAVWCNARRLPKFFRTMEFLPDGVAGAIVSGGEAEFGPVNYSLRR